LTLHGIFLARPDPVPREGEVRIRVERLNLDAASFRQLERKFEELFHASA
jgi:hypothetical protein